MAISGLLRDFDKINCWNFIGFIPCLRNPKPDPDHPLDRPVLFPLYGVTLEDYLHVTIHNRNAQPVRSITESEIIGFSDKASDTVDVPANDTVEVTENPRLTQSSLDSLDIARPGSFHLRVVYLQNGDEKLILDETSNVTLTARRDFPWTITGLSQQEDFQLLAAMITPTDPSVEALIRQAANHTLSGMMIE
jgi:hypothetical protein